MQIDHKRFVFGPFLLSVIVSVLSVGAVQDQKSGSSSRRPIFADSTNTSIQGLSGAVVRENGSREPFTAFTCAYESHIGHTVNWEALIFDGKNSTEAVPLTKIQRIEFIPGFTPNHKLGIRGGTIMLVDRRTIDAKFYVNDRWCRWLSGSTQRTLSDPTISALIFLQPKR